MDLDQAGADGEYVGRNAAFGQGRYGTPGSVASTMNEDSAVFNAKVAGAAATPHSVLQPLMANPGGLGMSKENADNRTITGQYLGSGNGMSKDSFDKVSMLRMIGGE